MHPTQASSLEKKRASKRAKKAQQLEIVSQQLLSPRAYIKHLKEKKKEKDYDIVQKHC